MPSVIRDTTASDGTRKWLLDVGNGNAVDCVFIPEDDRGTLCISSQAGCALDCAFCSTGKQGFNRNLTTAEIVAQLRHVNRVLREDGFSAPWTEHGRHPVTNVVMMGMGEPLANFDNVVAAMNIMLDDNAYGLSRRRVTLVDVGHRAGARSPARCVSGCARRVAARARTTRCATSSCRSIASIRWRACSNRAIAISSARRVISSRSST